MKYYKLVLIYFNHRSIYYRQFSSRAFFIIQILFYELISLFIEFFLGELDFRFIKVRAKLKDKKMSTKLFRNHPPMYT